MPDYWKFCMTLKSGNYELAATHLKAIEQQNVNSYNSMLENGYLSDEDKVRREKRIAELRKEIDSIESHDELYTQRFISENEAYSRNNLKDIIIITDMK